MTDPMTLQDERPAALIRVARRLPFYQRWRRPVLYWLRHNGAIRRVVKQLTPPSMLRRASPVPGLSGGHHLVGEDIESVPVVLFVCLGWREDETSALVQQLAEMQTVTGAFRAVFVLDNASFGPLRRHGFVFETITPRSAWEAQRDPADWPDYLRARLSSIVTDFGVSSVVPLPPGASVLMDRDVYYACTVRVA